jgi:hypothetical protein
MLGWTAESGVDLKTKTGHLRFGCPKMLNEKQEAGYWGSRAHGGVADAGFNVEKVHRTDGLSN